MQDKEWHMSARSFVANEKVIEIADRWLERIQRGFEAGSGYGMARVDFPTVREVYRWVSTSTQAVLKPALEETSIGCDTHRQTHM